MPGSCCVLAFRGHSFWSNTDKDLYPNRDAVSLGNDCHPSPCSDADPRVEGRERAALGRGTPWAASWLYVLITQVLSRGSSCPALPVPPPAQQVLFLQAMAGINQGLLPCCDSTAITQAKAWRHQGVRCVQGAVRSRLLMQGPAGGWGTGFQRALSPSPGVSMENP